MEDRFGIFAKETEERVLQWMFRFATLAMFVDGNPINSLPVFVRPVRIALVMLHVNAFVKHLTESDRNGFHDAEEPIPQRGPEIRVVNEIMGNAVDVP